MRRRKKKMISTGVMLLKIFKQLSLISLRTKKTEEIITMKIIAMDLKMTRK